MRSMLRKTRTALIVATFGLASASAWAANHNVTVGGSAGLVFVDAGTGTNVTNIAAGDTVTFTNSGGTHNAASDPGAVTAFHCSNACGTAPIGNPDGSAWSATITFPTPGTIPYHCDAHQSFGMVGTINVTVPVDLQSFKID